MVERKEYLDQLWAWKDERQIKVVTGIRRCGKSVLLEQYQQRLLANGVAPEQIISMAAIFIQATYIMIPLFLQMNKLNLLNSLTALGVLYATMQFPFAIFLLTGFLRSIPRDYEEAAMIDGCGPFRILTSIIIPMCKPGIVTVCMISAMAAWNEYPVALVMVTDPTKATLPVGLANLYEIQRYATDWGALFAALVLALIPTVILFIVGQKQLVQGLSVGGVKG